VLDPTFGTGGVVANLVGSGGEAQAVAISHNAGTANEGKIVVAGWDTSQSAFPEVAVARYNVDGSLDTSFNKTGSLIGPQGSLARAVAIQPVDGRILAAGASASHFAIFRYNVDGTLDKTFGTRGVASTTITTKGFDAIWAMGLQADGKIVVAGTARANGSSTSYLVVARYFGKATTLSGITYAAGGLDPTFGAGGMALSGLVTSPGPPWTTQMSLAIDAGTGNIVVEAPDTNHKAMVVRYDSSGRLDTSLAGTGYEALTYLVSNAGFSIQPSDGKIVVAGHYNDGVTAGDGLVRLNANGTLDAGFGNAGAALVPFRMRDSASVKIQADGKFVVGSGGYVKDNSGNNIEEILVTRFASSGSLDTSFGVNGAATVPYASLPPGSECNGMAFEPDGRIVVAGFNLNQFEVARFLATGPQIDAFTSVLNPNGSETLTASSITDGNPAATITQVGFYYFDSNGNKVSLGNGVLNGQGDWTFTVNLPAGTTVFAQAEDNYGVFGDPVSLVL
jgi:uncharacterized delta-60 repeat protein